MTRYDLAGQWHYNAQDSEDFSAEEYDHSGWPLVDIPQNWHLAGLGTAPALWLRLSFSYNLPEGRYASLCFEGVDYRATVYLNGQRLGEHEGFFEPFSFDISDRLTPGQNLLALRVECQPEADLSHQRSLRGQLNDPAYPPSGGVWGQVHIEQHGPITIERTTLRAELNAYPPMLHVHLAINNRGPARTVLYNLDCYPENSEQRVSHHQHGVPLGLPSGYTRHRFSVALSNIAAWESWDRGHPNLYRVVIVLIGSFGEEVASSVNLYGFRTVQVGQDGTWLLNGAPGFLRGARYLPTRWLAETTRKGEDGEGFFEQDLRLLRGLNINMLWVQGIVLPDSFYAACDRLGLMVWQDMPLFGAYVEDLDFHDEVERQAAALMYHLVGHSSIVAWVAHVGSSGPKMEELNERVMDVLHHLGSGRVVIEHMPNVQGLIGIDAALKAGNIGYEEALPADAAALQSLIESTRIKQIDGLRGLILPYAIDAGPGLDAAVITYQRQPGAHYETVARALQPDLPVATLPHSIPAGSAWQCSFDLIHNGTAARGKQLSVHWRLSDAAGSQVANERIEANLEGLDPESMLLPLGVKVMPALAAGHYRLSLSLRSLRGDSLAENTYEFQVG